MNKISLNSMRDIGKIEQYIPDVMPCSVRRTWLFDLKYLIFKKIIGEIFL